MEKENTRRREILSPTTEELTDFFRVLANNTSPVVLLSTVPEYADDFVSKQDEEQNLPPLLSSFYKDECRKLSPLDLEAKCQEVLTVTKSEAL